MPRLETASPRTPTSASRPPLEIEADQTVDLHKFDAIEPLVQAAIAEKKLPGAVVLIGRGDRILYHRAFGSRALVPAVEAMSIDTIFDLASLTKVVATTTSVMMLIERGKLRLNDRVSTFIPGFERYGKADITIRHLLTHMSGLRPDLDLGEAWTGSDTAIALAVEEVPTTPAGQRFVYSDINFELLGEIVHTRSGFPLDQYAKREIFDPLGMTDTMFNPPPSLRARGNRRGRRPEPPTRHPEPPTRHPERSEGSAVQIPRCARNDPHNSQPFRYSRVRNLFASGAFVNSILSAL